MKATILAVVVAALASLSTPALASLEDGAPTTQQEQAKTDTGAANREFDYKNPNDWVSLGKNAGLAIMAVAKEIGVAGDKILESNTGKIAVVLIAAKVMDVKTDTVSGIVAKVTSFATGMGLLAIFLPLWGWYFRHLCIVKEVRKTGFWKKEYVYHDLADRNVRRQRTLMTGILFLVVALLLALSFGFSVLPYLLGAVGALGVIAIFVAVIFFALEEKLLESSKKAG